ncbi:acyltransferase family protein [Pseudomonas sp. UV AK001]|uniref:acyltransferase family protein n=1 Tax=Pseudomonas sp. UV AK001 TaxID=3384791 RepID=UPI0038D46BB5
MLISVQALRALAAWMVVGHHVMQIFFDFEPGGPIGRMFVDQGAAGVDVFFVISGLVMFLSTADKNLSPWRFMALRLMRIAPAYWFYTVVSAILLVVLPAAFPGERFGWPNFMLSLLFVASDNPGGFGIYPTLNVGWTLNFEMLFYLLFAGALLFPVSTRIAVVAVLLFLVCNVLTGLGWISEFYRSDLVVEFLLGMGVGMLYRRGWIKPGLWGPIFAMLAALVAIHVWIGEYQALAWGVPAAVLVMSALSLERFARRSRLLKLLGDCSYSVYLIHTLILMLGHYLAQRYSLSPYVVITVCLILIGAGSLASYKWIEKAGYRHFQRWSDRPSPA